MPIKHTIATLVMLGAVAAMADIPAIVTMQDGRELRGQLRWQTGQKQYLLTSATERGIPMTLNLPPAQIKEFRVQAPKGWEEVVSAIREGRGASVVPRLEAIVKEYAMMQYDVAAGSYLVNIHLNNNRAEEALKAAEGVIKQKPDAGTSTDLAPLYWRAMLETGKTAKLAPALDEAMKTAPRPVAARACILRGDLLKSESRTRDALKDGYLRTVTLFRDQRAAQPEALFKAAQAFEELQEVRYAEKMRQQLLTAYSDSEYAKKLRGN